MLKPTNNGLLLLVFEDAWWVCKGKVAIVITAYQLLRGGVVYITEAGATYLRNNGRQKALF